MTSLADFQHDTAQVCIRKARGGNPEKTITVRGLSPTDVMRLVNIHGSGIAAVFDAIEKGKIALDLSSTAAISGLVIQNMPNLIADVIRIACDMEATTADEIEAAHEAIKRLPISAQMEAIEKITELTFVDATPGEFVEVVVKMMGGMRKLVSDLQNPIAKASPSA